MRKNILIPLFSFGLVIFVFFGVLEFWSSDVLFTPVAAQGIANCDVCGYCDGGTIPTDWEQCRQCVYPDVQPNSPETGATTNGIPTPNPDYNYTMIGCISTKPSEFTTFIINKMIIPIVGGIAFLYLLYGAGIVATSQTEPEKLNYGKRIIYGAIVGLIFVLLSTFFIKFIAIDLLKLPGFGGT